MQRPSFSIYDASAGSGKTYTLVKEYLKIILSSTKNDAYRSILAITFTNKAVHEMKTRIVGNLNEFAKETPSSKALDLMRDLAPDLKLSVEQIQLKSKQIIKHLIHNYAAFDISTIDKFTHRVIRAFAYDLNLPISFEVTLDTESLLIEAVDALIAQAGRDDKLTKLLVDFTMTKIDDDKSWDVSREILETGKLIFNENNRNEILSFKEKSIEDFVDVKTKIDAQITAFEKQTVSIAAEAMLLLEKNNIDLKSFSGGFFPKHLQSIVDGKFNPKNKQYHEVEDVKINKTATDRDAIESLIPDLLQKLKVIYALFHKVHFYKAILKNITPLSLLNTVSNELSKIQEEQNVLSIAEFNAIIHREIQNQPAPFIYERIGERYRHFFIDEFQDTSQMQWENLIPLIDNALAGQDESGEKGTLMIVGDPKQSIYRWRGGKAEQFIELSKSSNPFSNNDKKLTHLDTNYRSFSEVIHFNNDFFNFLSGHFDNPDYKDLYENHSFQKDNAKKGGYVNISFLPKLSSSETESEEDTLDKVERYVLKTVETIQKVKKEGFDYKDIVILTRKKDQGVAIANYLTEQKIPLISSETLLINNASEVRVIIHFLEYLHNKANLEAKANLLYYIGQTAVVIEEVADFIAEGMQCTDDVVFENWLLGYGISFSFSDIRKKTLYEAVDLILRKVVKPHSNNAYVQFFLDLVLEKDIKNQAGIADFLVYWHKNNRKFSIPSPDGNDAVRIMTIHKSKGLEFPVVIMPFADEDYVKKPKDKLWLDADEEEFEFSKLLVDNTSAVAEFGDSASELYHQKKQEELLDNVNVLYVALTRAEEQLYVISQMQTITKSTGEWPNTMASFFIRFLEQKKQFDEDKLEYEFGAFFRISSKSDPISDVETIPFTEDVFDLNKVKIAQKEALMWGTHQREAIAYGNVIHEILSFIKYKSEVDLALHKALELGLIILEQVEIVKETIYKIIYHPRLSSFYDDEMQVLNEQELIQQNGKILKPDRMVFDSLKKAYVVDYKTGKPNPKYNTQLLEYADVIELMGFEVVEKALVYIGEDIEVVFL
ncbi:UvrD-helicase domain-containing protein [Flavobacterium agrisoli]|uniref:DNA 3'-5' helicase n=1 Tax=Flavobacterium agrisoli TaxID=2793066 RepID=A0A934PKD2_9FLAO|nr:UvrD-helicase domain-containing protein [Flavobacterium agrisoli]MBK0369777.1 UvrD-helicase domain-containing protein [Flavobacterium agrisoli]